VVLPVLFFVPAPYGRYTRQGRGPTLSSPLAWVLMELPSGLTMAIMFAMGNRHQNVVAWVFLGLWEFHYAYRSLVFPWLRRANTRRMPLTIVLFAVVFNVANRYMNGRWLFALSPIKDGTWLMDPRFVAGAIVFGIGFWVHVYSDQILLRLRKPGDSGYSIPTGGAFGLVSCPNYFGELIEWSGWAMATWSLAGLGFAFWTAANLVPRAVSHHRWYRDRFPEYPRERRAVFPFVL
jgi:3-oxo-5-alpha-steroid 4-dehydrogenase 1